MWATTARLFALVSFAAADSQISVYDTKYVYNLWRPVTAIQHGDADGNRRTIGDVSWTPLIVTPPYPEYSSGANCFTASITTVLRKFFGTNKLEFQVWSTSANLATNPRTYQRFTDVEQEMVEVRIWQGIHFRTAEEVGRAQGRRIGQLDVSQLSATRAQAASEHVAQGRLTCSVRVKGIHRYRCPRYRCPARIGRGRRSLRHVRSFFIRNPLGGSMQLTLCTQLAAASLAYASEAAVPHGRRYKGPEDSRRCCRISRH